MNTMTISWIRLIRALIAIAIGLPVAGLVAGLRRTPEPPPPPTEVGRADLPQTYWDWNLMSRAVWEPDWVERAGLRREEASPSEAAFLTAAIRCHRDPSRAWRDDGWRESGFPDGGRWYKLVDPADEDRWVGVGVFEKPSTRLTICRMAIGFDPDAELSAAPGGRK